MLKKIIKKTKPKTKSKNTTIIIRPKRSRRRPRRFRRRRRNTMSLASTIGIPRFNDVKTKGTTAIVTGSDLVYQIREDEQDMIATDIMTIIPANPAYWEGTRVATIAAGYQNFRPLIFEVHYVPTCAATQPGTVVAGTLWNQAPAAKNLQQTLKTSNGGILTQAYKPAVSHIKLGANLQYNLYRMGGNIDQQAMPFIYIAKSIGCKDITGKIITPGYFYVKYKFEFRNPIGAGILYQNYGLQSVEEIEAVGNVTAYTTTKLVSEGVELGLGSRLDVEVAEDGYAFYNNGTPLEVAEITPLWILSNQDSSTVITRQEPPIPPPEPEKIIIEYSHVLTVPAIPPHSAVIQQVLQTDLFYTVYVNPTDVTIQYPVTGNKYATANIEQNFGKWKSTSATGIMLFTADKQHYELKFVPPTESDSVTLKTEQPKLAMIKEVEEEKKEPQPQLDRPNPIEIPRLPPPKPRPIRYHSLGRKP